MYKELKEKLRQISIHSLRGEGDLCIYRGQICTIVISIHSLRGEGDSIIKP